MSRFKMKRGQESKVNSLAKEDGSLIFSLNGANNSTVRLDQTVNGTVQRLGIAVDKAKDADGVIDYNEPTRRIKIGYAGAGLSTSNLNYIAGYTNNGTQIKDVSKDVLKNWLGTMGSADSAKVIEPFENATVDVSRNVWFSDSGKRNKPVYNDNFKYNPVSQILTTNISGSAENATTARYLFQANEGGAAGKNGWVKAISIQIKAQYCNSPLMFAITQRGRSGPTFLYVYFLNVGSADPSLGTFSYSGSPITAKIIKSATSIWDIWIYKTEGYDSIGVMMAQYDFPYIGPKVVITYPDVFSESDPGTGTSPFPFGNVSHSVNSDALGGSSLSQVLASAGGGNAFTTIDTATNNVIKLTRANGGTVQKTVNNVSNASSASFASKAALASTATNASTADYAKSAAPSAGSLNYVQVLNSSNINGSASYTVNELAKHHFAQGMINAATDNPLGKTGWVHVQSMAWTNGSDQWASQLALDVQDGSGMYYRSSAAGGHLAGRSWNKLLDNTNYTDYAADKTAFSGVSISGRDITLTRANGGTVKITTQDSNTTYPVHEGTYDASFASSFRSESFGTAENGWHLAAVRTNVANVSYAPQYGSGIAWARGDTHGYLYVDYYWANAYIGGGSANRLNWQKQLAFLDSTVANATSAENASHLGGKVASDYALKTDLSGDINALSAKRLPSYQSASVANSFFYRYGTAGNTSDGGAWTGFPSTTLYSEASTANGFGSALFQKKVGVLHLAAGSSAHDLVFQAGGTNGGIAYVATGRNPAYILDTLNYKDKAYTFNKLTAASTFTATSGVVIDGGSY